MKNAFRYSLYAVLFKEFLYYLFNDWILFLDYEYHIEFAPLYDTFLIVFIGILILEEIKKLSGNKSE